MLGYMKSFSENVQILFLVNLNRFIYLFWTFLEKLFFYPVIPFSDFLKQIKIVQSNNNTTRVHLPGRSRPSIHQAVHTNADAKLDLNR